MNIDSILLNLMEMRQLTMQGLNSEDFNKKMSYHNAWILAIGSNENFLESKKTLERRGGKLENSSHFTIVWNRKHRKNN